MPLTPEVRHVNAELIRKFGFFLDKPKFRIVWTGDCIEKRLAEYEDRDSNGIFIRQVTEVREVPKYPYVSPSWWMLERAIEALPETIKAGDLYEPLYLFRHFSEKGDYGDLLPVRLDMALLAAEMSLVKRPKRTYAMDKAEFEAKEAKVEADIFEQVKDMTSDMAHLFHHKEAVIMDGKSAELPISPNLRGVE